MGEPARRDPPAWGVQADELDCDFVGLYRECLTPMVRLAWGLTGSENLAEDLVHDAFIRVHAHWDGIVSPRAYLYRTVVNACRSASRRARRERRVEERHTLVEATDLEADELFDALAELPYRQRAALVLRYYEGLSHSEIAVLLNCREGTVGSLVHRGLAQLRRVIEP